MKSNSRSTKLMIGLFLCGLLLLTMASLVIAQGGCPPNMLTAQAGNDSNGNYFNKPASWTQPSGCSGTYKVLLAVYASGPTYGAWVTDNATGQYVMEPRTFTSTIGCPQSDSAPSVTLQAGHSYTLTVDEAVGSPPTTHTVWADARIFAQCQGN